MLWIEHVCDAGHMSSGAPGRAWPDARGDSSGTGVVQSGGDRGDSVVEVRSHVDGRALSSNSRDPVPTTVGTTESRGASTSPAATGARMMLALS